MQRILSLAILMWRNGRPIPIDLETKLINEGYDVRALEQRHRA